MPIRLAVQSTVSTVLVLLLLSLSLTAQVTEDGVAEGDLFSVIGEVSKPGDYRYSENLSVKKAIEQAGGLTSRANRRAAEIVRGAERQSIDLQGILAGTKPDMPPLSGDKLVVRAGLFRVEGMVKNPGEYELTDISSPLEALTLAGGVVEGADMEAAYLERKDKLIPLGLDSATPGDKGKLSPLQIGDVVMIPERTVTVTGEVARPGVYKLIPGRSDKLQDAIIAAGGVTKKADLKKVQIKHLENNDKRKTTVINVTKASDPGTNPVLKRGDGVYVPSTDMKKKFGLNDLYQALIIVFTLSGFLGR